MQLYLVVAAVPRRGAAVLRRGAAVPRRGAAVPRGVAVLRSYYCTSKNQLYQTVSTLIIFF